MTRADWAALLGFVLLVAGFGMISKPLAVIFAGLLLLAIAAKLKRK